MSEIVVNGSSLGNALNEILMAEDIQPGDMPSYELCKVIWITHPLGNKIVQAPIEMAQSQTREIAVTAGPGDRVRDKFIEQWENDRAEEVISQLMCTARAYGISTLGLMIENKKPNEPVDYWKLPDSAVSFSIFDPLNTAGSLVLNQDPLSIDFMKVTAVAVSGEYFHRSRTVTMMNERPVYISYTSSAFGFVGRSVFQRALFPLKSFIQTMITDDLIVKKAGVFIAMIKAAGAIIDNIMQSIAGLKRFFIKAATNGNVISIGVDEKIETLNMQNIDGAYGMARKNILENIATAADMPAIIMKEETFAEGFGEGTEDAKKVARWIDRLRRQMRPAYVFMDLIVQHRAWNESFFEQLKDEFPDLYKGVSYKAAFFEWQNTFSAEWPSLLTEPDSEKVKTDDVKLKAIIATVEVFGPMLDPENKATLVQWAQDNINENKLMFQTPLQLNTEILADYEPPVPTMGAAGGKEPAEPKPFAASDSADRRKRMRKLTTDELDDLVAMMEKVDVASLPKPNGHLNGSARRP